MSGAQIKLIKNIHKVSISLTFHVGIGNKTKRGTVYAVTYAVRGLRVVCENVPKMGVAGSASDLGSEHTVTVIRKLNYYRGLDGF